MLRFFDEIKDELDTVERELHKAVKTPDPLMTESSTHLLKAGGKRLRPALSLLGGKCDPHFELEKVLPLAVALEMIHMATLVHDDVVDASLTRRGKPTVKARWGNRLSTHLGDYLFARALILVSTCGQPLVPRVLADTSVKMCEGEIEQISTCFDTGQTVKDYFYRINRKTALLIAASCQLGAAACGAPAKVHQALRRFGHYIGMAFQITDDVLDLVADQQQLGKPVGSDLRQGIITLPVIYALENSPRQDCLRQLVFAPVKDEDLVYRTIGLIGECGGIAYSVRIAQQYIHKAKRELQFLPDRPARKTLSLIADFVSRRNF
ncbi:polyprenyl synthetase family protein [Desulfotomaculum copahuensis]|uniref:Heptaprenyl diphosphate synthase n=1 Tax=Desulfotomaculum copahuensis TaxID=1838280 RepID=A0A1B7LHG6_9FIRM|nr:polyprenyl synthetase family protein [Desulfotomaculum copahuensis]OAT85548.1 heptaprenyl diphosphate synthase [Desulfotomaculum copahuensis]